MLKMSFEKNRIFPLYSELSMALSIPKEQVPQRIKEEATVREKNAREE